MGLPDRANRYTRRRAPRGRFRGRAGWTDVAWRAWQEISDANLFLVAGGVTYALLLALFPGLAALVSIYGLILNPAQVEAQVGALSGVLPDEFRQLLSDQLHSLVSASSGTLGVSAVVGLLLALWSASRGMTGLITALNIAYEEKEKRGFFKLNALAIGLTLGLVIGGLVIIALMGVMPAAIHVIGLGGATKWLLLGFEWPLAVAIVLTGLAIIYRYAPDRDKPQWRWVSPARFRPHVSGSLRRSASPSTSPTSTAMTRRTGLWVAWSFSSPGCTCHPSSSFWELRSTPSRRSKPVRTPPLASRSHWDNGMRRPPILVHRGASVVVPKSAML